VREKSVEANGILWGFTHLWKRKEPGLIHTVDALQPAVSLVGKSDLEGYIEIFFKKRKDTSQ